MSFICLILSGAALLINGLGLLGRVPARDSGFFNLVIGALQLLIATLIAVTADGAAGLISASGIYLFGLTYLYVGLSSVAALGPAGTGWFCGLVAVLALAYSALAAGSDPVGSVLWLAWAVLWSLFFGILALGAGKLTRFTGWSAVLVGTASTVIPALLGLAGSWPSGWGAAAATGAVVVLLFAAAGAASTRVRQPAPAAPVPATA